MDDHLDEFNEIDLSDGLNRFGYEMLFDNDEIMDESIVNRDAPHLFTVLNKMYNTYYTYYTNHISKIHKT
jgi:hypothetical protein